jgi:hypothetical protein
VLSCAKAHFFADLDPFATRDVQFVLIPHLLFVVFAHFETVILLSLHIAADEVFTLRLCACVIILRAIAVRLRIDCQLLFVNHSHARDVTICVQMFDCLTLRVRLLTIARQTCALALGSSSRSAPGRHRPHQPHRRRRGMNSSREHSFGQNPPSCIRRFGDPSQFDGFSILFKIL